ncbi:nitrite reductase/ring-hydroxylating ferredoxin subunit [Rhizobium sp. SG_E_25_P2]|jgi:nitrite reductase/ring-hydroxylating ferredoxin subunit|uniref:Rieske (2Fe-2S) protein n=1 Tax=Rhizobium sp. SG_E_25_P2 TaxID=2879942 RepID=UPI00247468CE|nr:Rieske 2Fe-2S domain-containing protein [Rhizobium sp. SG_E_25_P2]MDH6269734.1 nitrite reductase/ring-hydroxylating ferredoxin subunit [Rhizobium sp. SG_E_25_P2]
MLSPASRLVGLCNTGDVDEGEAKGFGPVGGYRRKIIVLRKEGRLHAWLDACPHYPQGTPMAWRSNAYLNGDGTHIACHSHGALFDMQTGECVLGPCLGQGLTRVELTVNEQGEVFAALAEEEVTL